MIYVRNNAAKQWIFDDIDRLFGQTSTRILDLGCGTGQVWKTFLGAHPAVALVGIDTDSIAVAEGKRAYIDMPAVDLRVLDAQRPLGETFDVVVALSAIEHVVNRPAFLQTVWSALRSGGRAYLNYDVGHFRSHNLKERLMVPVSQALALVGIEGPYMKQVDDHVFCQQAQAQGFCVRQVLKHNLSSLKRLMRSSNDDAIGCWFAFEEQLRSHFTPDQLDPVMWSTTLVIEKP